MPKRKPKWASDFGLRLTGEGRKKESDSRRWFDEEWCMLVDKLWKMHRKGVRMGMLRKRITFVAGKETSF